MSEVKGFKLVPASMLLDKETIGVINFHCGDGADGQFGEYSDGHLWVGTVTDDDGKEVYGLHLSTAEYPEEGSSTLVEFESPEDAAQSELAALREELAEIKQSLSYRGSLLGRTEQRLADAERRNADRDTEIAEQIESALRRSFNLGQVYWQQADSDSTCQQNKSDQTMEVQAQHILNVLKSIRSALNPTESGESE